MPNQARQIRRQRQRPKSRVVRRRMEMEQWFIGKNVNRKTFYVAEHDAKENITMWTPNRRESISFNTERAAHKYISRYLHDRTDVILVTLQTK